MPLNGSGEQNLKLEVYLKYQLILPEALADMPVLGFNERSTEYSIFLLSFYF